MASTYVNNLRLNELATGDASGTWGTVTNLNLELIGQALGIGTEGITTNANTHTSTIADGAADEARAMYIKYTGTLDSACTITIGPNTIKKVSVIENATSGSQNIIIKQGSGATVTIPNSRVAVVTLDGAGSGAAVLNAFTDLDLAGTLSIAGAVAAAAALTVGTDLTVGDDLTLESDAAVLGFGADTDVTLTHVADTGLLLNGTSVIQFNDSSQSIGAPSNAILDINATDEIELNATLCDVNANLDVSGTIVGASTLSATTITASTAFVPDASDGAALGTTSLEFSDLFLADGAVIGLGDDQDVTFTHVADTGVLLNGASVIQFRDSAINIGSPANGDLDINADDEIELNSTLVDLNGNLDVSGTIVGASTLSATTGTFSGVLKTDDATNATSTTDGSLQTDGGLSVALDVVIGDDLFLLSDSAVLNIGAGSDLKITHDGTNGDFESAGNLTFDVAGGIILDGAGDITLDSAFDIILDADANDVIFKDAGTEHFRITNSGTSTVTLDAVGDITLDAGGGDVNFADDGTAFAFVAVSGNNAIFGNPVSDGKIFIQGSDGGDQQVYIEIDPAVGEGAIGFHANGSLAMNPIGITMSNQASGGTFSYNTDASSLEFSTFRNNGTQKGSIVTTANATSFNTSSDYRLKQNVDYDWDATTECKKLKPCQFKWIGDVTIEDGGGATAPIITGFLAHELQAVVPDAAFGVKDATETYINDDGDSATRITAQVVDQAKIIAILTKTILELEARITALE